MRVTNISVQKEKTSYKVSADFFFESPLGGKKAQIRFWFYWVCSLSSEPIHALRRRGTVRKNIWFRIPAKSYSKMHWQNISDAFFLLALPLAIAKKENLFFDSPVSQEVMQKVPGIYEHYQEIVTRFIQVTTQPQSKNEQLQQRIRLPKITAQFFTLGVDSFYSLSLRKKCLPDKLLYVDGFDTPFYYKKLLDSIHARITQVARSTDSNPVFVQTNLREVSDKILGWGRYHVTALVAVSTILECTDTAISGESFESDDWGLRTGIDRLYSTTTQNITFVAHNVSRLKKIQGILDTPFKKMFIEHVRVCWENVRQQVPPYNCSLCQKCLKTQITLSVLGIQNAPSFSQFHPEHLNDIRLVSHVYEEWKELLAVAQERIPDQVTLLVAIKNLLQKPLRV